MKSFIFDLDGVVIDSEALHRETEQAACNYYGLAVPVAEWANFSGKKYPDIFSYLIENYATQPVEVTDLIALKQRFYLELAAEKLKLIHGAREFLEHVRGAVSRVGLATSSGPLTQRFAFAKFGLHHYFDAVSTGDEVKHGKPHPEIYHLTMERLGAIPEHTYVIEDSDNGIKAAKAAGATVIGLTTSFSEDRLYSAGADHVFHSFEDAYQFV
jgi:HAD superfamily hydrolase (TIGR01509 family)